MLPTRQKISCEQQNGYMSFYTPVQLVHIAIKLSQVCNRIKTSVSP